MAENDLRPKIQTKIQGLMACRGRHPHKVLFELRFLLPLRYLQSCLNTKNVCQVGKSAARVRKQRNSLPLNLSGCIQNRMFIPGKSGSFLQDGPYSKWPKINGFAGLGVSYFTLLK